MRVSFDAERYFQRKDPAIESGLPLAQARFSPGVRDFTRSMFTGQSGALLLALGEGTVSTRQTAGSRPRRLRRFCELQVRKLLRGCYGFESSRRDQMTSVDPRPRDELVGRTIGDGRFRLERLLGSGASGRVYVARQRSLDRCVAIKVLRQELASSRDLSVRFRDEAMVTSRLNHPNIAAVLDCSEEGDELTFIAMEYVAGVSLYNLIDREAPLELTRVTDLFAQILSGLEEAHEAGVVHADLKTPNIVVTHTRGGIEQPKLVDFGIAVSRVRRRELNGVLHGTPEYLAPEVIRGSEPTPASDIYGAGIILYEMLVGTPPFTAPTLDETLLKHLEEPVPRIDSRGNLLLERLDAIMVRALDKNPRRRFRRVAEFRAAVLAAALNAGSDELSRLTIRPRRRPVIASTEPATVVERPPSHSQIRRQLRDGLIAGELPAVTDGYLELAAAHARRDDTDAAIRELEEGIDVINGLESAASTPWQLQLALASVLEAAGSLDRAITEVLRALYQCQSRDAVDGCLAAHRLLAQLYTSDNRHRIAARHRDAVEILERRHDRQMGSPAGQRS